MSGLPKWEGVVRENFFTMLSSEVSVAEARRRIIARYPDAFAYEYQSISNYLNSETGKSEREEHLAKRRLEIRKESFANKDSRIIALVDLAKKQLGALREMHLVVEKDGVKKVINSSRFVALSREFRETLKSLREETDPYGLDASDQARDAFQNFIDTMAKERAAKWQKKLMEDAGWTTPPTSEIPSN